MNRLLAEAREFGRWMGVVPDDRFLGCLPLFHMAGQAFAMAALANGAAFVLVRKFSGHEFWSQVRCHGITVVRRISGGGAMFMEAGNCITYSLYLPQTLVDGISFADSYAFLDATHNWTAEEICLAYALTEPALATVQLFAPSLDRLERLAETPEREMPPGLSAQIEMARWSPVPAIEPERQRA